MRTASCSPRAAQLPFEAERACVGRRVVLTSPVAGLRCSITRHTNSFSAGTSRLIVQPGLKFAKDLSTTHTDKRQTR